MNLTKNFKESRALPGGLLDSKEHTDYEDWLEEISKKNNKDKENDTFKTYGYLEKDCGENGYHDDFGKKIDIKDYPKIFQEVYEMSN